MERVEGVRGLIFGLTFGGAVFIQFYCNGCTPLNYARFLDYAAERIFLRKVGGGYSFAHRYLMEYFVSLEFK